jgi:hypothetical protein
MAWHTVDAFGMALLDHTGLASKLPTAWQHPSSTANTGRVPAPLNFSEVHVSTVVCWQVGEMVHHPMKARLRVLHVANRRDIW